MRYYNASAGRQHFCSMVMLLLFMKLKTLCSLIMLLHWLICMLCLAAYGVLISCCTSTGESPQISMLTCHSIKEAGAKMICRKSKKHCKHLIFCLLACTLKVTTLIETVVTLR